MSVTKAYKHLINCCKLERDCDDANTTRRGFTLIELVLVLMILAILAGSAMSMVPCLVRSTPAQQTAVDQSVDSSQTVDDFPTH